MARESDIKTEAIPGVAQPREFPIVYEGPAMLYWRDGNGTIYVLDPEHHMFEANIASMTSFRRKILRAHLDELFDVLDKMN